ncbi:MAG: 3-deoxy-manno-octulosonate cytidylyltransferase [Planctomycetota bacterium]
MRRAIVIPVRLESTRLPRKPLLSKTGRYLVQHVYERAVASGAAERVAIATDSEEVRAAGEGFGAEVFMTRADHVCGTDRIAEVAERELRPQGFELVVNLQGDEPEIPGASLERLFESLEQNLGTSLSTLACPLEDEELDQPDVVKVVFDRQGRALYFSRAAIPFPRDAGAASAYRHIGIYGYRIDYLLDFARREPMPLERRESLEQLRALESGDTIRVIPIEWVPRGIDTPADYEAFLQRCQPESAPSDTPVTHPSRGGD